MLDALCLTANVILLPDTSQHRLIVLSASMTHQQRAGPHVGAHSNG
jgi:hypothetical protein